MWRIHKNILRESLFVSRVQTCVYQVDNCWIQKHNFLLIFSFKIFTKEFCSGRLMNLKLDCGCNIFIQNALLDTQKIYCCLAESILWKTNIWICDKKCAHCIWGYQDMTSMRNCARMWGLLWRFFSANQFVPCTVYMPPIKQMSSSFQHAKVDLSQFILCWYIFRDIIKGGEFLGYIRILLLRINTFLAVCVNVPHRI